MCRVEFSRDSRCIWALASMPQPDTDRDTGPTTKQPDSRSSSSSSSSCIFCFSVANGSLLQQLPQPHGTAAVSSFCLDADGGLLATCGSNHLVKLWNVASSSSSSGAMPACQSFTAHHGAVAGALKARQL
jgi:WD40 repeat protein